MRKFSDTPVLGTVYVLHVLGSETILKSDDYVTDLFAAKFEHWDTSLPHPYLHFTPDDLKEPQFTFVYVGAEIRFLPTPDSWLRWNWSLAQREQPGRLQILGWNAPGLTEDSFAQLCRGAHLFQALIAALTGRPRRSFERDRNWYLDAFRKQAQALGRPATQAEFCEMNEVPVSTVRRNLKVYGLWPWDVFVQHASSANPRRV